MIYLQKIERLVRAAPNSSCR